MLYSVIFYRLISLNRVWTNQSGKSEVRKSEVKSPSRASINSDTAFPLNLMRSLWIIVKNMPKSKTMEKHIDKHRRIWFWQDRRWYKPYAWSTDLYCPTREQRCWNFRSENAVTCPCSSLNVQMGIICWITLLSLRIRKESSKDKGKSVKVKKKEKKKKKKKGFRNFESRHDDLETSLCLKSLRFELLKTKHWSSQIIRKLLWFRIKRWGLWASPTRSFGQ